MRHRVRDWPLDPSGLLCQRQLLAVQALRQGAAVEPALQRREGLQVAPGQVGRVRLCLRTRARVAERVVPHGQGLPPPCREAADADHVRADHGLRMGRPALGGVQQLLRARKGESDRQLQERAPRELPQAQRSARDRKAVPQLLRLQVEGGRVGPVQQRMRERHAEAEHLLRARRFGGGLPEEGAQPTACPGLSRHHRMQLVAHRLVRVLDGLRRRHADPARLLR
mmetsp:Transcript_108800/g.325437  ORF Transcript_108800/g.325437 Transcript_108800/m.325437 type:complete len:225 (+) Transcript_108800:665-1339(+)